ncbi:urea ABC transporter permease subunit UrtB [Halopseudomonas salegens]|uniref:Amino acid/amide ABC transporter membrane protein 1, HAAT family n=1 Tax=Halopseudomonas salegens TaxID=1434072 RepID=A0A1H2GYT5_9GAMM|nr:urea ABC transporter permease subunit UrtB [Halopseudomonas salegens]SDU24498.1 amino acid/amide ABC transporter membrane protein 1, HAAT family [Halopseudomonas salegens]
MTRYHPTDALPTAPPVSANLCQRLAALVLCLLLGLGFSYPAAAEEAAAEPSTEPDFTSLVQQLPQGNLAKRAQTVTALSELEHERLIDVLTALQEGNLLATRDEPPIVVIRQNDNVFDAISGDTIDEPEGLRRVPVNNRLRSELLTLIARLSLNHPRPQVRYDAVRRFIDDGIDSNAINLLIERRALEDTALVNGAIDTAFALFQLQGDDREERLLAVSTLSGSLERAARNALRGIADNDVDPELRLAASEALDSIQTKMGFYRFIENLFFGLSLGSVLLLAAIGLAITFGVMGVINMAHGELIMIGAYTTWGVQVLFPSLIEWSLLIAIPSAFVVAGLVGILIERGVIRFLYGRPLETLLATFGLSLVLQQAVRTLFSPLNRSVSSPEWISGILTINPVLSITYTRLYILAFGLMVFFALLLVMKKTSLGLKVRAVSQNRAMARAVGVRSSWVDALTFGLGSGIAGIAGVALSQITNVGPNLGQAYIIDSFMVVVFGGVGNLWGTLVSAMTLGLINNFLEPYAGAMLAKVLVLVMLILFIQKKPKGLFPQKGRAAAD